LLQWLDTEDTSRSSSPRFPSSTIVWTRRIFGRVCRRARRPRASRPDRGSGWFVVPLLPGGLGLRDGTLIAFLATTTGVGAATAIAIALRLANTLGEFLAIGLVELSYQTVVRSRPARRRIALGVRSSTDPRPVVTDDAS